MAAQRRVDSAAAQSVWKAQRSAIDEAVKVLANMARAEASSSIRLQVGGQTPRGLLALQGHGRQDAQDLGIRRRQACR